MSLLKRTTAQLSKITLRIRLRSDEVDRMNKYCEWLGITVNDFMSQSIDYIVSRDKEYRQYMKLQQESDVSEMDSITEY